MDAAPIMVQLVTHIFHGDLPWGTPWLKKPRNPAYRYPAWWFPKNRASPNHPTLDHDFVLKPMP